MMAHLNWCLEKLKFYDNGTDEEDFEEVYRYIYETISTMEEMSDIAACEYCIQKVSSEYLEQRLKRYNINLNL